MSALLPVPVDVLDRIFTCGAHMQDVHAAVYELIDFIRASPCECLGPMPISTGATLPAAVCDRCKALTHAGVTP